MRTLYILSLLLLLPACSEKVPPTIYGNTDSGKRVQLNSDESWKYAKEHKTVETKIDLKVTGKWDAGKFCRIGLSLTNRKAELIRNLGLELTAYLENNISVESRLISFSGINPTKYQYREAIFNIPCEKIQRISVHGTDHCSIGEHKVKFASSPEACLKIVHIEKNEIIKLHK